VPDPVRAGDAFAAALLWPAMHLGAELRISDGISSALAAEVNGKIQDIYRCWNRKLTRITAGPARESAQRSRQADGKACTFSGGVDSFYTYLKNKASITHLLFVQGFDIRIEDTDRWKATLETLEPASREMGVTLLPVRTNLRALLDPLAPWPYYHGGAIAAVGHALSGLIDQLYIASTHSYADLFPWGSHPLLDPLWSSEAIRFVHDGAEATRVEKVMAIADKSVVQKSLRVCWQNVGDRYNCGKCEKCLRTMINLAVCGQLDRCTTFPGGIDLQSVERMELRNANDVSFAQENLDAARLNSADPALIRAIEHAIKNQGVLSLRTRGKIAAATMFRKLPPGLQRRVRSSIKR
jgi:hypothetical protein